MDKPWKNPERVDRVNALGKPTKDWYEILGFDVEEILDYRHEMPKGEKAPIITVEVPARAVMVFSSALLRRKQRTLTRTTKREASQARRQMRSMAKPRRSAK